MKKNYTKPNFELNLFICKDVMQSSGLKEEDGGIGIRFGWGDL